MDDAVHSLGLPVAGFLCTRWQDNVVLCSSIGLQRVAEFVVFSFSRLRRYSRSGSNVRSGSPGRTARMINPLILGQLHLRIGSRLTRKGPFGLPSNGVLKHALTFYSLWSGYFAGASGVSPRALSMGPISGSRPSHAAKALPTLAIRLAQRGSRSSAMTSRLSVLMVIGDSP